MSSKKNNRKKKNNNIDRRELAKKRQEEEDKELDEIEKIISSSDNSSTTESENFDGDTISSAEEMHDDNSTGDNEDFFKSLDNEDDNIKVFQETRSNRKKGNSQMMNFVKKIFSPQNKTKVCGVIIAVLAICLITALAFDVRDVKESDKAEVKKVVELKANNNKEINTLIKDYFKALVECNMPKLGEVMDSVDNISEDTLKKESEYIEDYKNIKCYSKKGIAKDEYVVYVYYENKILNIDTLAPGAVVLYVKKDAEKNQYRIHNGINDTKISSYISKISKDKDVKNFNKDVNAKLSKACSSDTNLKAFYDALMSSNEKQEDGTTSSETTVPETTANPETPTAPAQ